MKAARKIAETPSCELPTPHLVGFRWPEWIEIAWEPAHDEPWNWTRIPWADFVRDNSLDDCYAVGLGIHFKSGGLLGGGAAPILHFRRCKAPGEF
jgi:hypothetical protein